MKNSKKVFILTESVLGILVIILAVVMLMGRNGKELHKVSVIVENSDDNQWAAFRYGLRMAAEDQEMEMSVVSTEGTMTLEEQQALAQQEIDNGADGIILQPVPGEDTEEMLKKIEKKVPVMLVESTASQEPQNSSFPVTQPDNYAMGKALGAELLKDCGDNLKGKTLGIISETPETQSAIDRERGFREALKGQGVKVSWSVAGTSEEGNTDPLGSLSKVDFVIALDDTSLTAAGEYSAANDLHGAIVYGIGNSTEAAYYLDTGAAQCLVVPDEFNVGYQSFQEVAEKLGHSLRKMEDRETDYTVIRRDTLFTKENQEILFTMSQ